MSRPIGWWRHAAIAGFAAGLLLAPHLAAPQGWLPCGLAAVLGLIVGWREVAGAAEPRIRIDVSLLLTLAAVAALLGLGAGTLRVEAIDAGALRGQAGESVGVVGHVTAVPTRGYGDVRVQLDTPGGRVVAVAPDRSVICRSAPRSPLAAGSPSPTSSGPPSSSATVPPSSCEPGIWC